MFGLGDDFVFGKECGGTNRRQNEEMAISNILTILLNREKIESYLETELFTDEAKENIGNYLRYYLEASGEKMAKTQDADNYYAKQKKLNK